MIGKNNWAMVKCATPGCQTPEWLMHWPCSGSEDEIRYGQHFCGKCWEKAFEATCNADPVRSYPIKRVSGIEINKSRFVDTGENDGETR